MRFLAATQTMEVNLEQLLNYRDLLGICLPKRMSPECVHSSQVSPVVRFIPFFDMEQLFRCSLLLDLEAVQVPSDVVGQSPLGSFFGGVLRLLLSAAHL